MEKKKVLVAMSGGVDSSVTAALLKEEGHEVGGATMITWPSDLNAACHPHSCCGMGGVRDARAVAERLRISHWVFNFETEFRKAVIDEFAEEYRKGRTPNPCISCNEHIKFRLFLERARQLGYDTIATGHYARIGYEPSREAYYVYAGCDPLKDQSYVLYPLSQDILKNLILCTGRFTKKEIREKARRFNLPVWSKPDSQEICFIPDHDYGGFLKREYGFEVPKHGAIRTKDGKVLGEHEGYFHYTRGQRRGLGVAYGERIFVVDTNPESNEVVVGLREDVLNRRFEVGRVHWFLQPDIGQSIRVHVKVRYLHGKAQATLTLLESGSVRVVFDEPQEAITKGQGAVFYDGQRILGGGRIDKIEESS